MNIDGLIRCTCGASVCNAPYGVRLMRIDDRLWWVPYYELDDKDLNIFGDADLPYLGETDLNGRERIPYEEFPLDVIEWATPPLLGESQ